MRKKTTSDKYDDIDQNSDVYRFTPSYDGFKKVLRDRSMVLLIVCVVLAIISGTWLVDASDKQHDTERAQDRMFVVNEIQKLNPQNITIISNPSGIVVVPNATTLVDINDTKQSGKISSLLGGGPKIIHDPSSDDPE